MDQRAGFPTENVSAHWWVTNRLALPDVLLSARRSLANSGLAQAVHFHAHDLPCSRECYVLRNGET